MATEIPGVAERLAREFADVPPRAVMEAVCSCAGEWGEGVSPLFVEQAARARLVRQRDPLTDGRADPLTAGRSAPASLPGSPG